MIIRSSEIEDFPISLGEAIEIKHFIAILRLYEEEGLKLLEVNLGYYKGSFYLTEVKTQAVGSTREELDIIYEKKKRLPKMV